MATMVDYTKVYANAVFAIGANIILIRCNAYTFDGWTENFNHYRVDISQRTYKVISIDGNVVDYSDQQMGGDLILYCNGRIF